MGEVVQLSNYRKSPIGESVYTGADSLVPIEFAVGCEDRNTCIAKVAEYGVGSIHIRMFNEEPDSLLYLVGINDAIRLNKRILETEELSDEEIAQRIDLVQMLENMDLSTIDCMWDSFALRDKHSTS